MSSGELHALDIKFSTAVVNENASSVSITETGGLVWCSWVTWHVYIWASASLYQMKSSSSTYLTTCVLEGYFSLSYMQNINFIITVAIKRIYHRNRRTSGIFLDELNALDINFLITVVTKESPCVSTTGTEGLVGYF